MESWNFLTALGLDLRSLSLPRINKLQLSGLNGKVATEILEPGGFGISRYLLDSALAQIARRGGVDIRENTKVNDIVFDGALFTITTGKQAFRSKVACACFGKKSNIDIRWKRPFVDAAKNSLNNFIGIKYHVQIDFPSDTIALHTFNNGYCGLVRIDGNKYNLCYLTTAANLQKSQGNIDLMEQTILSQNPFLKTIFATAKRSDNGPVTISQISFDRKAQVENRVLMIGDAAGMITPLCGNGMSMALHASKIAAEQISLFLQQVITRAQMEKQYSLLWKREFNNRLWIGRRIQALAGRPVLVKFVIAAGKFFPSLLRWLTRQTHGRPF